MDIETLLRNHGIPVAPPGHHHTTRDRIQVDCPHCSPGSGRYRMGIHRHRLTCHCWACGGHRLRDTLLEMSIKEMPDRAGILPAEEPCGGKLVIPKGVGSLQEPHIRFLEARGLSARDISRTWGVKGLALAPRLSWRLWIPVTIGGRIVSWTTRAIGDVEPRYLSAEPHEAALPLKHALYGADMAHHAVVIVEGPADAWNVGPGAVALFGVGYTPQQVAALAQYPVRVVCMDSDSEGRAAAERLCSELSIFPGDTYRVELDADDPGSASKREVRKLRKAFLD